MRKNNFFSVGIQHGDIIKKVDDGTMAREFWDRASQSATLTSFRDQVTLKFDLQQVDRDLLQQLAARQAQSSNAPGSLEEAGAAGKLYI